MNKKAFTLIELIIVMALVVILGITEISVAVFYKKTSASLKTKESLYKIREFLSYSKKYCLSHNSAGYVVVKKSGEGYSMTLYINENYICKERYISNMVFMKKDYDIPQNTNIFINVNDRGVLESTSIYLLGDDKQKYIITIAVGSNKISIRKGRKINE